jgi:hypothetical protein
MTKKVQIGTTTYNLPEQGSSPKWGEDMSSIIEALIAVANNTQGPNDILESSATIANTGSFPGQINGYYFDPVLVRSFVSDYNISRKITKSISSTSGDGITVTINTIGDHYLRPGDAVTIVGLIGLAGSYTVTACPTSTSFEFLGTFIGDDNTSTYQVELLESGTLYGNKGLAGWKLAHTTVGNARTELDIDTLGHMLYYPEILIGSGYSGTIRFLAKSISNS